LPDRSTYREIWTAIPNDLREFQAGITIFLDRFEADQGRLHGYRACTARLVYILIRQASSMKGPCVGNHYTSVQIFLDVELINQTLEVYFRPTCLQDKQHPKRSLGFEEGCNIFHARKPVYRSQRMPDCIP
jgi:hypothetical protein